MDELQALAEAIRLLAATDKPGTAHTLGPATSGHWCNTCRAHTLIAADVVRIDQHGTTPIAVFMHCPTCPVDGALTTFAQERSHDERIGPAGRRRLRRVLR